VLFTLLFDAMLRGFCLALVVASRFWPGVLFIA
jgi:hypothetical protein